MKAIKLLSLAGAVALVVALGASTAKAGFGGRQYYTGWSYCSQGYWYSTYNYKPYVGYPSYCYNYCIWYPKTPKFCYFFNPYKGTYWGRYDAQTKGYSLLAEKDRAGQLKDIPEKAFPAEGPLPQVPDAKDKLTLAEPPDLPLGEQPVVKKTTKGEGEDTATADTAGDALTTTPADAAAAAAPAGDALAADPKADAKADPKAPAAGGAAPATPPADGAAPAAPPAGGAAPGGPATPGDAPVTPDSGTGVVPPAEPVTPPPAAGGAAPVTPPAGGAAPVDGGPVAPVGGGVVAPNGGFYPSNCKHKFGSCPSHGYGPGYNWGWHK